MRKFGGIVTFPTADLEAAKRLFTVLLGVEPYADSPYYVGYRAGEVEFGLVPNAPADGPTVFWDTDDLDGSVSELVAAGATVRDRPRPVGGGLRVATLVDGAGNVIGLREGTK